jgi:phosphatidylinositol-3-phosphatase
MIAACSGSGADPAGTSGGAAPSPSGSSAIAPSPSVSASSGQPAAGGGAYSKVLVIAEENESFHKVLGGDRAPFLTSLAQRYGSATSMDAGYPTNCPSLAAYLIMTSGDRHGVCDDEDPAQHRITGPNIFEQVASSGREWRNYAESMPAPCTRSNHDPYLVRHAPAPYYVSEDTRCDRWMLPLGTTARGALHDDLVAGRLPAYGFVTPDACNDMHGGHGCQNGDLVTDGDRWLSQWLPQVMAGPDYRAGRLIIMITWDEGNDETNHIPALVISPSTNKVTVDRRLTQCNLLRTIQDVLHLTPLGCAATAAPVTTDFGL